MNKSVMKCCICNNENIGEFITINDKKYHLCCIKQLQQENQELKAKIKTYEDPEDLTLMFMYCDEKAKDKIRELKKQLEESKDNYNCLLNQKKQFEYIMSKQVDYQGQQK